MIDRDLARLYGVSTSMLNQAVRRHLDRFPDDFMFQMSRDEAKNWISQIVISNTDRMGFRKQPLVFTEQGIAMLSSVLNSPRAIAVNIQIMRTFTRLRELVGQNEQLRLKVETMEKQYDEQFRIVFDAIKRLLESEAEPKTMIGFRT